MATEVSNYPMGSLYVDNLHPDVTDAMLFDKFVTAGRVISIHVCQDTMTNQSLGCAYINFQEPADAELAINTMNSDLLLGCPLRIIWSRHKSSLDKSVFGKLIVKNLDRTIDSKTLYDTFRTFGNILSCNVMTDENDQSKGFGFVVFEIQETADEAIDKINGMLLGDQKVSVIRFVPREQRKYTNIFIKNYDDQLDEDQLRELISKYGKISNFKFETDENGHSRGFGFCSFENPAEAEAVIQNLHGYSIGDKQLYVGPFSRKRINKYKDVNVYVKNLNDTIDEERLRKEFSKFGTITLVKIMSENGRSKGFGFVCFSEPEEATKAVAEMNGVVIDTKELYVALAQRKEERRMRSQQLTALENETSQKQKQMLGECLFPLVQQMQPELAGKLTGMLLELDNTELLHMLESQEELKAKVEEAIAVLQTKQLDPAT